jgi:hypothetical protein
MQEKSVKQGKFLERRAHKGRTILKLNLWIPYIVMHYMETDLNCQADNQ